MATGANTHSLPQLIEALQQGGIAIVPTETVYGLTARADRKKSVDRIYTLKGRGFEKPLALCVENLDMAKAYGHMSGLAEELAAAFWPGPLSLVVKAKALKSGTVLDPRLYGKDKDGNKTVSLRCPQSTWLSAVNAMPLALTSANLSGQPDPLNVDDATASLGEGVDVIFNGPSCAVGLSSTVIAINGREASILRAGSLTPEDFVPFNIQGRDWHA